MSETGGKTAKRSSKGSSRAKLGLPAKAGKRQSFTPPKQGNDRRKAIIGKTQEWILDNPQKALTPQRKEEIPSIIPGYPAVRSFVTPALPRTDLLRAVRGNWPEQRKARKA